MTATHKKIWIVFPLFLGICSMINAQEINAKAKDFKDIIQRPLIIELLELDQDQVDFYDKRIEKAKNEEIKSKYVEERKMFEDFVEVFNNSIPELIAVDFDLHPSYKTMSRSEVDDLRKDDSNEFTVLSFNEYTITGAGGLSIPTLRYGRIESKKADYTFFLPYTEYEAEMNAEKSDFSLALKIMKEHIKSMELSDKNIYTFWEYAKDQVSENCNKTSEYKLNLENASLGKKESDNSMKAVYKGDLDVLSDEEFSFLLDEGRDELVGISIPNGIKVGSTQNGSAISVKTANVNYNWYLINVKSGEIYAVSRVIVAPHFRSKGLLKMLNCK